MKCKYDIDGIADMVRGGYGFTNLNENGKSAALDLLSIAAAALADGYTVADGVVMKQCGDCNGVGSYARAAHACGGDNERCHRLCPIEEQIQCELCNCTGFLPITRKSVVEGGAG